MAKRKTFDTCSFCGKSQEDGVHLIAGKNANICDSCVEVCNDVLKSRSQQLQSSSDFASFKLLTPKEMLHSPRLDGRKHENGL